jgi:hypothetical protein
VVLKIFLSKLRSARQQIARRLEQGAGNVPRGMFCGPGDHDDKLNWLLEDMICPERVIDVTGPVAH